MELPLDVGENNGDFWQQHRRNQELNPPPSNRTLEHYGVTRDQYNALLHKQGYACAICKFWGGPSRLVIDHDHHTGNVRGLLCDACNIGLGLFGDYVDRLEGAIAYLNKESRG